MKRNPATSIQQLLGEDIEVLEEQPYHFEKDHHPGCARVQHASLQPAQRA